MRSQCIKAEANVKTAQCNVCTQPGGDGGDEPPRDGRGAQALGSVSSSRFYLEVPVLHV